FEGQASTIGQAIETVTQMIQHHFSVVIARPTSPRSIELLDILHRPNPPRSPLVRNQQIQGRLPQISRSCRGADVVERPLQLRQKRVLRQVLSQRWLAAQGPQVAPNPGLVSLN